MKHKSQKTRSPPQQPRPNSSLASAIRARFESGHGGGSIAGSTSSRSTNFVRWRIGRIVRRGGLIALPASKYFAFLQHLRLASKYQAHEQVLTPGLAQFAILPDANATALFVHLLAYVQGAKRLTGLEGLFLSCMLHLQTTAHRALFAAGAAAWREFGPSRDETAQRSGYVLVYDRQQNVLTALHAKYVRQLYSSLATDRFHSPSLALFIRGLGDAKGSPTTGPLDLPFGAADDRDHCKDRTNTIVQAVGVILGAAAGAIAASQQDKGSPGYADRLLGIFGLSIGGGAATGAAAAPWIASAACKDGTPEPTGNDAVVSGLVAAVQSNAMSVDQALDAASAIGSEPNPPATSGDLDSLLDGSPDPYFDVTPEDLANELPGSSGLGGSEDKPDNVDQETWDLINQLTSPSPEDSGSDGSHRRQKVVEAIALHRPARRVCPLQTVMHPVGRPSE
jgi:hypothetical protein